MHILTTYAQISQPDLDDNMTDFHSGIDSGRNWLKTLPSRGDPAVADGRRLPLPPADRPPGGHDRDAGDGADDDELARLA